MTKPLDLDELERVADAATEGPWEVTDGPLCPSSAVQTVGEHECSIGPRKLPIGDYGCDSHDATHIATFDPPTVRALIARVRELEAERGKLAADLLSQETQMIELEVVNANQGKSLIALISERDQLKARVAELVRDLQILGEGCYVRKVHLEWPALEGRIKKACGEKLEKGSVNV